MEKHELLNQTLKPVDRVLDFSVAALRKANLYTPLKKSLYETTKLLLNAQFKMNHSLRVYGTENIPREGGAVFAINHQSWLDAQVVTAACPRKIAFMAKSEFKAWPILHHVIELTDSVYVHRGGDDGALDNAIVHLREGGCVGIFPEGTIPGEEDIPRWDVEPDTGLLRGKSGVVRLAMRAGVPIIPVGVSGTGKAFPPEAYPRLEQLPLVKPEPIEVRFGEPIFLKKRAEEEISYDQLRGMTDRVMRAISHLVDHSMGYVPMSVPIAVKEKPGRIPPTPYRNPPLGDKTRLGVLVLHGFTSHVSCVSDLRFPLDEMGVPYRIPILRGHGGEWTDLKGVTAEQWYEDAEDSLLDLLTECRRVVVVGLSMGGLVALDLAARRRKQIVGVATVAAALKFKDPLSALTPVIARVVPSWPSPKAFHDKELEKQRNRNYPRFPTRAFAELYRYAAEVEQRLSFVAADALIVHSRKDQIVHPKAAEIIRERLGSKRKDLVWFEESGHEMLLDLEAQKVVATVADFIRGLVAAGSAGDE
jgi:carboxylesterase